MLDRLLRLADRGGPIVATAIHDGHAVRPDLAAIFAIDEATRLREEDPFTGRIAIVASTSLVGLRSRFELDLNRPRDRAVYRTPEDAFGLHVWREPPSDEQVARSLDGYDAFYRALEVVLRERERRHGRFVVLDIHSYNHRRGGPLAPPEDPALNPEINVGTRTVDRARWGPLVDRFCADLRAGAPDGRELDVRENVRFRGAAMSAWIHRTFPESGCALALEFKKTFMDEWTGQVDHVRLSALSGALASTFPGLVESLAL
ncbi:MAG: N-formylglutamate amidohydrolase [Polyangiaceae bacterium]|nr:N-formylglutamate amidohydrolase [Polyangiaceae bacterium]